MADWLTPQAVLAYAREDGTVSPTDAAVVASVSAAQAWVAGHVESVNWAAVTGPADVPADVTLGSMMLAWRWYQRRNSPLGVAGYQDYGTSALLRHDPDIAKLLGIGADGPFVFAAAGFKSTDALPAAWVAATAYVVGDRVSLVGGAVLLATVAGTSGDFTPAVPVVGGTVTDGSVTWVRVS